MEIQKQSKKTQKLPVQDTEWLIFWAFLYRHWRSSDFHFLRSERTHM